MKWEATASLAGWPSETLRRPAQARGERRAAGEGEGAVGARRLVPATPCLWGKPFSDDEHLAGGAALGLEDDLLARVEPGLDDLVQAQRLAEHGRLAQLLAAGQGLQGLHLAL